MGITADGPARVVRVIAERYEVLQELGRGGAAVVYQAYDRLGAREVALKQLSVDRHGQHTSDLAVLFQREFHTLAQLSHPRIIEVFDFGVEDAGPYYTMELLLGGDLRSRAPLAWQDACRLLYDVCSSLALIHARRWVHRDVTPLNIRCTADGRAKLIDFGAMVPMGPSELGVGTPPFTAPEVIQCSLLDARTDLFSVGATLYYVLTGSNAYPARNFAQLPLLWQKPPVPPSLHADVPPGLDALVLSLLRPEPAARPASAFDVMQRLAALAGIVEPEAGVSHAYLTDPNLVSRDHVRALLERAVEAAVEKRGGSIVIAAESGLGRSRLLEVCALKAKLTGAVALRGRAGRSQDFALMQKLFGQLFERIPDETRQACSAAGAEALLAEGEGGSRLTSFAASRLSRLEMHALLMAWLRALAQHAALVITIDDLEGVDEASVVLLAALASELEDAKLLLVATVDPSSRQARARASIGVFMGRSQQLSLAPLSDDEMLELARSVFGEVQHLGVLSAALSRVSLGRPRLAMELLQHLVDEGRITYRAGQWTLPAELLERDLPRSGESAVEKKSEQLGPLPRRLLELQVLASHEAFSREDYACLLDDATPLEVNDALSELLSESVLVSDGAVYRLAHRGFTSAVLRAVSSERRTEHHRRLAKLYENTQGADVLRHWLESGDDALAIERALALLKNEADTQPIALASRLPIAEVAAVFVAVLDAAERRVLSARGLSDLRRAVCSLSTASEESYFYRAAPAWLAQLSADSGLDAYRALDPQLEPGARLAQALRTTGAAYAARPEDERVYSVPDAIRNLLHYAVAAIAIGTRTQDSALLESLPDLLSPFAMTSPIAHALWQNVIATCEAVCWAQPDAARERWLEVQRRLIDVQSGDLHRIEVVRQAVAYGIAAMSAYVGLGKASELAERVERDPRQRVNALYLRRVIALQHGDGNEAEGFRRKAEIAALHASTRQMFGSSGAELPAHVAAHDLVGVRQIIARLAPLAERFPGWRAYKLCAEGYFELLRGDYADAKIAFEACRRSGDPHAHSPERHVAAWVFASAGLIEALIGLDRCAEAYALGVEVMRFCDERKIVAVAFAVARALAMAEARLGQVAQASARLESVIAKQEAFGASGVYLGLSYEMRVRVAILAGAWDDVGKYAALAAREYRHGNGSLLAGRYERLLDEVRKALRGSVPAAVELALVSSVYGAFPISATNTLVTSAFSAAKSASERAATALALSCEQSGAECGHIFLNSERGLTVAASRGGEPCPALLASVHDYVRAERGENELTAAVTETVHGLDGRFLIEGVQYTALPLTCSLQGHVCSVGLLVLAQSGEQALLALDPSLLEGIGLKLLQAGDVVSPANIRASEQ